MNVYYDLTRSFIERLRGPSRAAGMGRVVLSWGRAVAEAPGGSLISGLSSKWIQQVIESEPAFDWMSKVSILHGDERPYFPLLRHLLSKAGHQADFASKAARFIAFQGAERASSYGIEKLFQRDGMGERFIYHCPLPEVLPRTLPSHCVPVINVYDIMPLVFRDTYNKAACERFSTAVKSVMTHRGHIIVNSGDTKHSLVCFFNFDSEHIHVVPLGADVSFEAESGLRPNSGVTKNPFLLYVAGSGQRRKNVDGTIRGFCDFLNRTGEKADLVIVGSDTEKYQEYADRVIAPERGRVHCLGIVDGETLTQLYDQAKVGLYLSLYEGFGLPILEYMHRGVPVVCGNATSLPEVAGRAATLVDALDPVSIGQGIATLWNDPKNREQAILAGKFRAAQFTWACSANCLREVYAKILSMEESSLARRHLGRFS